MKLSINEEKIHKQIQENKSKPESKKKSRWQAKLEELQKQQALAAKQQQQNKKTKK
jgi:YidC/Oxa1 family membrane protein insertase